MIAVHILYPKSDDSSFDMSYYTGTHMPMLADALGDACTSWGATTVTAGPYEAIGWCTVSSQEAWDATMAEHGGSILGDVPNYTNTAPTLVVGDVAR